MGAGGSKEDLEVRLAELCCPFSYARSLSPPPPPISSSSYIRHAAVVLSFWGLVEGSAVEEGNVSQFYIRGDRGSRQTCRDLIFGAF